MTSRLLLTDGALSVIPDANQPWAPEPENLATLPHSTLLDLAVYIGRQGRKHAIIESFIWLDSQGYIQNDRDDEEYQADLVHLCRTDPDAFRAEVEKPSAIRWEIGAVRARIDFTFHLDIRRNGFVMNHHENEQLAFLQEAQSAGVAFA